MAASRYLKSDLDSVSRIEFERLVENARRLSNGPQGPRVYLRPDQKVIKVFWPKKLLTSNRIVPYALRFKHCAEQLEQRGFHSVSVEKIAQCREIGMHFVVYPYVPGLSIRELGEDHADLQAKALTCLAPYIGDLHNKGVYFKALHLGNIVVQPGGTFALIDFHSSTFYKTTVSIDKRVKNFLKMLHYVQDYTLLENFGLNRFFREYLNASGLDALRQAALIKKLKTSCPFPELKMALADIT